MAFAIAWDETSPDGDIVHVSGLDDSDRGIKVALRERLEGDPATPDLTGLIEVGSWSAAPKPRKGAARAYVDTTANILAFDATKREDGRIAISSNFGISGGPRVYHVATAAVAEIGYFNIDGSRAMAGPALFQPTSALLGGTTQYAVRIAMTSTSAATGHTQGLLIGCATAAATYTGADITGINISSPTIGAGSGVAATIGMYIENQVGGTSSCFAIQIADQIGGNGQYAIYTGLGANRFGDILSIEKSLAANADLLVLHNSNANAAYNPQLTFKVNGIAAATISGRDTTGGYGQMIFTTTGSGGPPSGGQTGPEILFKPGGVQALDMYGDGTVLIGASGPIAVGSVGGFACIAKCAGTPTGVPTAYYLGWAPIIYDETGKKLWVRDAPTATWKGVVVA